MSTNGIPFDRFPHVTPESQDSRIDERRAIRYGCMTLLVISAVNFILWAAVIGGVATMLKFFLS
jgi:hypothetical protein